MEGVLTGVLTQDQGGWRFPGRKLCPDDGYGQAEACLQHHLGNPQVHVEGLVAATRYGDSAVSLKDAAQKKVRKYIYTTLQDLSTAFNFLQHLHNLGFSESGFTHCRSPCLIDYG